MNLTTKINLMKLAKSAVMNVGGEPCIVLPIKRNDLFVNLDDKGKVKAVYLDLVHWETKEPSKYGDTHFVKQQHSKEYRQQQTDEQRKAEAILGNTKPMETPTLKTEELPTADTTTDIDWNNMQPTDEDPFANSDPL